MAAFPHLFRPVRIGPKEAKDRVMRLATTINLAERSEVGERMLAHYRRVAQGGAGTLVTEALRVHPSGGGGASAVAMFRPEVVAGLRRLAEVVHAERALLIAQLNHGGRQHHASQVPTLWAPSAIACPHSGGVPHEMTAAEIEEMIGAFVGAAVHAAEGGLDGVEIHGAQDHLIQQFVSPFSNIRTDGWGGRFEKRLRFPREIIRRVREALGPELIVGYRLVVEEFTAGGLSIEDTKRVARLLATDGLVDYLSLAQGNFNTIETHLPDRHYPLGVYVDLPDQRRGDGRGNRGRATGRDDRGDRRDALRTGSSGRWLGAGPDHRRPGRAGRADWGQHGRDGRGRLLLGGRDGRAAGAARQAGHAGDALLRGPARATGRHADRHPAGARRAGHRAPAAHGGRSRRARAAILKHYYTGREERIEAVDAVVWIGPQRAHGELAEALKARGLEVHLVGDAFAPRRLANAIQEGHRAGRAV